MNQTKIISWNANGLRTRIKNKDIDPILKENPDIILFQETKASFEKMDKKFLDESGYNYYFLKGESERTGGLATFCKKMPKIVKRFFNEADDALGRASVLEFEDFTLIHIYAPTGTGKKANMLEKLDYYNNLIDFISQNKDENMIIAGDFNIAHEEKDIFDKDTKVSFTEEEREVIDKIIDLGFSDAYRLFNDDVKYSSWKNNDAKEANEGSRVDYFFVSKSLKDNVKSSDILDNIKSSKHAPIILNLE